MSDPVQTNAPRADATVYRPTGPTKVFNAPPDNLTALGRGAALRAALAYVQPGDRIVIGCGDFDMSAQGIVRHPSGVSISGSGQGATRILNNTTYNTLLPVDGMGCQWELCDGAILENLSLIDTSGVYDQACVVGFGDAKLDAKRVPQYALQTHDAKATLKNIHAEGFCFTLYNWVGHGNFIAAEGSTFIGGRWVVCQGMSSGTDAGFIRLDTCHLIGDYVRSAHAGAVGNRLLGIACCGGWIKSYNSDITLIGSAQPADKNPSVAEYVVGAWCEDVGHPAAFIELHNTPIRVTQGAAKLAYDAWAPVGSIAIAGGSGSGAGGNYVVKGNVTFMKPTAN